MINISLYLNVIFGLTLMEFCFLKIGIRKCCGKCPSQVINYSYGYKPIGVPHFGQVHIS